jgi:hypothetical protein
MSSACQTSTNWPSRARKISWPLIVTGRPVAGRPPSRSNGPVWVPVIVHRPVTRSFCSNATSTTNRRSRNALRTARAAQRSLSRPGAVREADCDQSSSHGPVRPLLLRRPCSRLHTTSVHKPRPASWYSPPVIRPVLALPSRCCPARCASRSAEYARDDLARRAIVPGRRWQLVAVAGPETRMLSKTTSSARRRDSSPHCSQAAGRRPTYVDNPGISAQPATGDGRSWTTGPLPRQKLQRPATDRGYPQRPY